MSIFSFIKNRINGEQKTQESPEGYCPNCWGRQEYEGKLFEAVHNEKIDLNNIDQKKGWIEAYAAKNFDGIKLKDGDVPECPSCKLAYR